jgi:hypothetical protein
LVPGASALPHWSWSGLPDTEIYQGNVYYDSFPLDAIVVGVAHTDALDGDYSAALGDAVGFEVENHNVTLSQTGTVPADASSVRFDLFMYFFTPSGETPSEPLWINNSLQLSLGGTALSLVRTSLAGGISNAGGPWLFQGEVGADVTSFAGQTAELKFLSMPYVFVGADTLAFIDNIYFSPVPVPEPSSVVLAMCGLGALLACARWRSRTQY